MMPNHIDERMGANKDGNSERANMRDMCTNYWPLGTLDHFALQHSGGLAANQLPDWNRIKTFLFSCCGDHSKLAIIN